MEDDSFNNEIDKYIEKLQKCEYIMEKEVKNLCDKAKEQISKEENVIYLNTPLTVRSFLNRKDMRRYPWSVLRSTRTIQNRWRVS